MPSGGPHIPVHMGSTIGFRGLLITNKIIKIKTGHEIVGEWVGEGTGERWRGVMVGGYY